MSFTTFREFVNASRRRQTTNFASLSASDITTLNRFDMVANSAIAPVLPDEGVAPAIFAGFHVYVKLELRPSFTTSSEFIQRSKGISLLADLTQGVRNIVHEFEGALLEAQGPVVHAFIPELNECEHSNVRTVSKAIIDFTERRIKRKAGDDFKRILVAYCHGPTVFVGSVDQHGDNSIVSLSPAANEPAKVLWGKSDDIESGSIIEVKSNGDFRLLRSFESLGVICANRREMVVNASTSLPD